MIRPASFSKESLSRGRKLLYAETEKPGGEIANQNQNRGARNKKKQQAQQQGETFDQMPQQQVQDLGRQGGEAEREPYLPL